MTPAIECSDDMLVLRLASPHDCAGWTLVGGGVREVSAITWSFATSADLSVDVDAEAWLRSSVESAGCDPDATAAFITSRNLERHVESTVDSELGAVSVVATVGLSNALRAGDPAVVVPYGPGTINIAVLLPCSASPTALLEALGIAQEAKAAAILGLPLPSLVSGEPATGTGTDASVVAAPRGPDGKDPIQFAGKHTSLGSAIGRAVLEAVERGAKDWILERQEAGVERTRKGRDSWTGRVVLVGGGVRTGKSRFAERLALGYARPTGVAAPVYIATAQALDGEMGDRIRAHREQRGGSFTTVEEPVELVAAIRRAASGTPAVILVDCLTLWLSNLLCRDTDDAGLRVCCADLVSCIQSLECPIVLVSNEVGLGLVPESSLGRRFRDASGLLHQALSAISDEVYFGALGTVLRIKPGPVVPMVATGARPVPRSPGRW